MKEFSVFLSLIMTSISTSSVNTRELPESPTRTSHRSLSIPAQIARQVIRAFPYMVLSVVVVVGYLLLRRGNSVLPGLLSGPQGSADRELLGLVALITGCVAFLSGWVRQKQMVEVLEDLGEQLDQAQENPMALDLEDSAPGHEPWVERLLARWNAILVAYQSTLDRIVALRAGMDSAFDTGGWMTPAKGASTGHSDSFPYERSRQHMIGRLTPNFQWQSVTPLLQKFLGQRLDDLLGRSVLGMVPEEDRGELESILHSAFREGEIHNAIFRVVSPTSSSSGRSSTRYVQMDILAYFDVDGAPSQLRCHFIDVTDRVRAEQQLRKRTAELIRVNERLRTINRDLERLKESYRDLYHHAPVMYFSLNNQGEMVAFNASFLMTLGFTREELLNQPFLMLLPPEAQEQWQREPFLFHRDGEIELQWVKKDGSIIDVWIGNTVIHDEDGRFHRSRSAARDVTERNLLARAVEERAQALAGANVQLRRINQELEDFTFVVSHDLKEPLRTLEAFSNFLALDCGPQLSEQGQDHIRHLMAASRRLGQLIDDLLSLSRAGRVIKAPEPLRWEEITETVLGDLRELTMQNPQSSVRIELPLPEVSGDPERIIQLLTNLLGNAIKYNNSEQPEIFFGAVKKGTEENEAGPIFYVKDNGIGIEPKFHEQIFRIFRRLHHREEYSGTGAGLAICKKIVEAHGGRIWVESEPGQGSTFYFSLPHPTERA